MLEAARASAARLTALLDDGWRIAGVEKVFAGKALGTRLEGRCDLVFEKGKARAVVDLKWSGEPYKRADLENGVAVQLATYAELLRQSGSSDVAVGYFIIDALRMLSTDKRLATNGDVLKAAKDVEAIWKNAEAAWKAAWKVAVAGTLRAPGAPFGDENRNKAKSGYDKDGKLGIVPVCGLCDYGGLCGRLYAKGAEGGNGKD